MNDLKPRILELPIVTLQRKVQNLTLKVRALEQMNLLHAEATTNLESRYKELADRYETMHRMLDRLLRERSDD
jgi:chromosome segregation ATPase